VKYTQQSIDDVKRASSMATVARIFCSKVKHEHGEHYSAVCCFHKDTHPSLDIDDSKGVFLCRACGVGGDALTMLERQRGCTFIEAIQELSTITGVPLVEAALDPPRIVAEWHYLDDTGARAYSIQRWEPGRGRDGQPNGKRKSYSQRLADGSPGKSAVQIPYRLPQLIDARGSGAFIVVTEGEKAADAVVALGIVATTWAGGTGAVGNEERTTWTPAFAEHFRGAHVALWPDNDEVGKAAMAKIAGVLHGVATEIVTITPPTPGKGDDADDWVTAGGTREGLQVLILEARKAAASSPGAPPPERGHADHLTDSGNAERFVRMHGADFRWHADLGCWMRWTGSHWKTDADAEALHATKDVARSWRVDMAAEADAALRVNLRRHAERSEGMARRAAMLSLAASEPGMSVRSVDLDKDQMALNHKNGTLDQRTGILRPARREDLCTRVVDIAFDPLALCPTWDLFLAQILPDERTREYLGKTLAYASTGVIREHLFTVLWGQTGRNGKGTLIEIMFSVLGEYATALPNDVIIESRNEPHPNMYAQLMGVRMGVAAELRPSDRLNEGMLKKLSGGDTIRARFMGGEFFSFSPTQKLISQTNFKPRVRGGDPALWARMRVIPFGQSFVGREDLTLAARLRLELPGIAAWLARHVLLWLRDGLTPPPEVVEATAEYREESDRVGQFLEENTTPAPMARIPAAALWKAFRSWCEDRGESAGAQNTFGAEVRAKGVAVMRVTGERRYMGILLNAGAAPAATGDEGDGATDHWNS